MGALRKAYYLHQLLRSQWKSAEELRDVQNARLQRMLWHAYANVPFYQNKFESAMVHPSDVRTVEDLQKLPVTTKQEIRDNFPERVLARGTNLHKCWLPQTSGSTGIPLTVAYDATAEDFEKAVALRANLSCGQRPFDKWVVVTSPHHMQKTRKWFQRLGLFSPTYVSMLEEMDTQIGAIERLRPDVLDGYSSALYLLARGVSERNGSQIHPRLAFGTADLLTHDMRQLVNSAFGVEICDQFGCVEFNRTAWECPAHEGYHVDVEAVVVEVMRDGRQVGPGKRGEVVYTGLYNYAMPLIRYASGDIAVATDRKCPCGRGLPLLEAVEGRQDAFVQLPSGRILPQMTFWSIMRTFPERDKIGEFRVVQHALDSIEALLVPSAEFSEETTANLTRHIRQVIGQGVDIKISVVESIPRDRSGKIRSVVSRIGIDWASSSTAEQ
jgi:phenylacetate-CoA ligase